LSSSLFPYTTLFRSDGSAFVCACLLPAMRLGEDVEVDGPVSPLLMRGLSRAHDLYRAWDPSLHEVAVLSAEPLDPAGPRAGGIRSEEHTSELQSPDH